MADRGRPLPGAGTRVSETDYADAPATSLLEASAATHPEADATVFAGRRIRYRELVQQARGLASTLVDLGVSPGGQVATLLPNLPQTVVALQGVMLSGSAVVPLSPLLRERELRAVLARAELTGLIALDSLLRDQRWLARLVGVTVVTTVADALAPPLAWMSRFRSLGRIRSGSATVIEWRDAIRGRDCGLPRVRPGDACLMPLTGGTTGLPKLAVLTHRNVLANALQTVAWLGPAAPGPGEALLAALPYFHVYGVTAAMNLCLASAATQVIVPRFATGAVLGAIRRHRVRHFPAVPRMFQALADAVGPSSKALGGLKVCISGADALPERTARAFGALTGRPVIEGYGLTEASPVTHCNPLDGGERAGSMGKVYPDTLARVVDTATGVPVGPQEVGELWVRGPQVMQGYLGEPEQTRAVLDPQGWLHTGDLVRVDGAGYFYLVGRKKDMMIVKGFKVYPAEVEAVLLLHPAVAEAVVVGVPDPVRGEAVRAFVVARAGPRVRPQELVALCRERMAHYKVPTAVEVVAAIPRSAVGKTLREKLRKQIEEA